MRRRERERLSPTRLRPDTSRDPNVRQPPRVPPCVCCLHSQQDQEVSLPSPTPPAPASPAPVLALPKHASPHGKVSLAASTLT
ncbi:hypothetical protein E2C01_052156 [Portunus trituberculatus]|uniref:Uncharacterized protein n=1 Tax=Portunus trituberculatus TaxID=210409 RepID=A0A5B7GDP5_PORTR|nr:hypothetical protein [Portunus trituberculatus]